MPTKKVLTIDLGGTKVAFGVFDVKLYTSIHKVPGDTTAGNCIK